MNLPHFRESSGNPSLSRLFFHDRLDFPSWAVLYRLWRPIQCADPPQIADDPLAHDCLQGYPHARRSRLPELVRVRLALAEGLATLRRKLSGDRGGAEVVRRLGRPVGIGQDYERGIPVPSEVLLKLITS
jgi:hypothetical protein